MKSGRLVACVLASALTASVGNAQQSAPAGPTAPAANPVDPASIQAVKDMGAYLLTLSRFRASTTLTGERVLADGQKLMHTAQATLDVQRPNKLRARMWSARSERELFYDAKTVTLYAPAQKYYSSVAFSEPLSVLIDELEERYGVQVPMADLFTWGTPAAPVDKIDSAMNAGQDLVEGTLCDHYAFRQGTVDWQIWIATGAQPLPRKIVITNLGDEARPQSVSVIDWDLKPSFKESTFRFDPPRGAIRIKIVPVKPR
ncbi:DUF2092 domain-containing protein [Variovorax sp. OV329]|uniref:DUF2092 domain-containing protein n=1 Tax=Variovorax sp. OV329 TaxID=1882825 RepID=UPI000B8986E5|nr:DUF2092 domain-containing protein [Variovorax sp. OV329]